MTVALVELAPHRTEQEWFSRKQAAMYLERIGCPISARMLAIRASNNNKGNGPPYTRIGWKTVRYRRTDLDAWAKSETRRIA